MEETLQPLWVSVSARVGWCGIIGSCSARNPALEGPWWLSSSAWSWGSCAAVAVGQHGGSVGDRTGDTLQLYLPDIILISDIDI